MDLNDLETWSTPEFDGIVEGYQGIAVSCSGGPDSTALFHVLWELTKGKKRFSLLVFHVNFGLRDKESQLDERFCQDLAMSHQVPYLGVQVPDSEALRYRQNGVGIQTWAREIRQRSWGQLKETGWCIATGHTLDDLAESMLFRLARGTTAANILGMSPFEDHIWRPFLGIRKREILRFLTNTNRPFRLDQSNFRDDYSRNLIRNRVLPVLEEISPGATEKMVRTGIEMRDLVSHLKSATGVDNAKGVCAIQALSVPDHLKQLGYTGALTRDLRDQAARLLAGESVTPVNLPGDLILSTRDGVVELLPAGECQKSRRQNQHDRNLHSPLGAAHLAGKAYVVLRNNKGICKFGGISKVGSRAIWQITLPKASQKLRFKGYNKVWILKELLAKWQVPSDRRKDLQVIWKDQDPLCLSDGDQYFVPSDQGEWLTSKELSGILGSHRQGL